ncbi:dynactin 3, p24 subunit [Haematobia irritans]|uniref:Putative dynactin subunit n=1 Tax=Haematobia irritans TaxID=7368 RepID=A0A1L8EC08_HAEIR
MEALDILEKRIDTLTRILGVVPDNGLDESPKVAASENVIDSLISANNIVNEAISGREKIKAIADRSEELETYLDPHFLEENQQVRAKEVYLNAVANDLHTQFQQLERIKELEPTLGAEYFRNIPGECIDKLKQVNEDNTEFSQQAELIEESLILAMKRYGEIQKGLLDSLGAMNKRLEAVEEKLQQNKKEQMEKELSPKDQE